MHYTINCHLLFKEYPLFERAAAAKAAGFDYVEYWWPFNEAEPDSKAIQAFIDAIKASGTQLTGLNFFAGDMPAGDRGLVSWAARQAEFRANVPVALAIGQALGCQAYNALYGNRQPGEAPGEADRIGFDNLVFAAQAAQAVGAKVLLEPISGSPAFPLKTAADCFAILDRLEQAGTTNVQFLCDLYHLAANGDNPDTVLERYASRTGHVQIADFPGRGEPGSGTLPLADWLAKLRRAGYDGPVGLEYNPTGATADSFAHLPTLD